MSAVEPGRVRSIVDWAIGLALIGIGVVGGFVPVLQGWVFVLAGLAVLSRHSRWARAVLDRVKGAGRKLRDRVRERRRAGSGTTNREG